MKLRTVEAVGQLFRTFNFMPWHRKVVKSLNQHIVTKFTDSAIASMRLNYRMEVNLTTHTQVYAFYSGLYDNPFIERLQRLMTPDCCVVDAGANIGFYTVPLTLKANQLGGQIHAFEPLNSNYVRILSNLKLNNISEGLRKSLWSVVAVHHHQDCAERRFYKGFKHWECVHNH